MKRRTLGEKIFQVFNFILLTCLIATILIPVMNIISLSISERDAILSRSVTVFPVGFMPKAYLEVVRHSLFLRSMFNTVLVTVVGTLLSVLVTLLVAYALTKNFVGKKPVTYFFVITMYFSGGLIPTYILYSNYYGLRNTYTVLFLPNLVYMFYIIVMRSQIEAMPSEVFEAAHIDGAKEHQTLFRVVLPMISPTIAAISMFFALGYWNQWFSILVYNDKQDLWNLQYFLRAVVFSKILSQYNITSVANMSAKETIIPEENYRMAAIVLVAAPIVAIYPFVQKYFVKGIISGAIKG